MINSEQLETIISVCPGARVMSEGGTDYVYLPALKVLTSNTHLTIDGLLCPSQHGSYLTRLFLAEPIQGRGQNWALHTILSRTWHTWSWNGVPSNLSLSQILSAHLRALR